MIIITWFQILTHENIFYKKFKLFLRSNPWEYFFWKTSGKFLEDFWSSGRLTEDFWKTYGRLLEDFDLGGKPKLFQNLDGNHKFY